jgi:hypothetical protein
MNRYFCRIILSVAAVGCLGTNARAVVVVAEDFFYKEKTKDITDLGGFTGQSYGGGQNGAGVWDDRWVAVGGGTIVGDDVTTPPLNANPHTAVVTEFASTVSLQRPYTVGSAGSAQTVYFAADFKVDDVSTPSVFAEFGLLSPATLNLPRISIGITDSGGTTQPTFFGKLFTTAVGNPVANANDALVSGMTHRIVGKLQINAGPVVGDYNSNGAVDAGDYVVWRNNLGTSFTLPNRDPANTGNVSTGDYNSWKSRFGQTGAERLTVYFNPTGVEQTNASVLTTELPLITGFGDGSGSLLTVATLNGNPTPDSARPFYIDNLAIGTSWADVATVNVPRLTLEVNPVNGQTRLVNNTTQPIDLAYYEILSASNSLNPTGWNSLDDQNVSGGAWVENSPSTSQLIESNLPGFTTIAAGGGSLPLGAAFNTTGTQDLVARWGTKQGNDGLLNLANVVTLGTSTTAAIPEPATWCWFVLGAAAGLGSLTRRRQCQPTGRCQRRRSVAAHWR